VFRCVGLVTFEMAAFVDAESTDVATVRGRRPRVRKRTAGVGAAIGRSRNWCFVVNNYSDSDIATIAAIPHTYCVMGKEIGPECGTPHLQGFLVFKNAKTLDQVVACFDPIHPHVEACLGTAEQNIRYCTKDKDFMEFGVRPVSAVGKGQMERKRWDDARAAALEGRFEDIDSRILVPYIRNLEYIHRQHVSRQPLADISELCHEWHYGVTGSGKSHNARRDNPGYYLKMLNKWWDNYEMQEVVLIEEFEPSHAEKFGSSLKVWCDHYPFRCEVKQSTIYIRPRKIIVTSNYSIKECFPGSAAEPLLRRFKSHHYSQPWRYVPPVIAQPVAVDEDEHSDDLLDSSPLLALDILRDDEILTQVNKKSKL